MRIFFFWCKRLYCCCCLLLTYFQFVSICSLSFGRFHLLLSLFHVLKIYIYMCVHEYCWHFRDYLSHLDLVNAVFLVFFFTYLFMFVFFVFSPNSPKWTHASISYSSLDYFSYIFCHPKKRGKFTIIFVCCFALFFFEFFFSFNYCVYTFSIHSWHFVSHSISFRFSVDVPMFGNEYDDHLATGYMSIVLFFRLQHNSLFVHRLLLYCSVTFSLFFKRSEMQSLFDVVLRI